MSECCITGSTCRLAAGCLQQHAVVLEHLPHALLPVLPCSEYVEPEDEFDLNSRSQDEQQQGGEWPNAGLYEV